MAARTDLLLDLNGDLPIGAKLMTTGPSDLQHQKDMFRSFPGEWKQFLNNGIGLAGYLKTSNPKRISTLKNQARQQLQRDGYNVGNMLITFDASGKMIIKTNATR
jgi:hypothetical protein